MTGLVTQNVDGLHSAAGSPDPLELHGALSRVVCLTCGDRTGRDELEARLDAANRDWHAQVLGVHPDGDVDLAEEELEGFTPVRLRALQRGAQARRGVLRRDGAAGPGGTGVRPGRGGRGAAGPRHARSR